MQILYIRSFSVYRMLYAFVQQQRNVKDNDKIYVTYLLAGNTEAGTGNKVGGLARCSS